MGGRDDHTAKDPRAAVQSVDRALRVLEIVADLGQAGVTEIAVALGVHKSTVSRLVAVLESRGYVEQVSDRGKYRLGFAIARLAHAAGGQIDLVKVGQEACDALSVEVGETANLAVLDQDRIVNIVEAIGPAEITLRTWVAELPRVCHIQRKGFARGSGSRRAPLAVAASADGVHRRHRRRRG